MLIGLLWPVLPAGGSTVGSGGRVCAYVTLPDTSHVEVVDVATNSVSGEIPVPDASRLAITPDARTVFVAGTGLTGNFVSVIDTSSNVLTNSILLSGVPGGVAVTPDGAQAFVAFFNSDCCTAAVIDVATATVVGTVAGGGDASLGLAITPDGTRAYIGHAVARKLLAVDVASRSVTAEIDVGVGAPDTTYGPVDVAVTPDGSTVYAVVRTVEVEQPSAVFVVDPTSNTVTTTITVGASAVAVAISPDGRSAYVANSQSGDVSVIDTSTNTVRTQIATGGFPVAVAFTPDGTAAYVADFTGSMLSIIDTAQLAVAQTIALPSHPGGVAIAAVPGNCEAPATPSPTPTITATPTLTATPTVTPTPSLTPTVTPTASVTSTATATASFTPTVTVPPTATSTPSFSPTLVPTSTVASHGSSGGCSTASPQDSGGGGAMALFLAAVPLAWIRRRRSRRRAPSVARTLAVAALFLFASYPALAGDGSVVQLDANGRPMVPGRDTPPLPTPSPAIMAPTPAIEPAPGGGEMMRVPDRFRNNTVGHRDAVRGRVSLECTRDRPGPASGGLRSPSE